MFPIGNVPNIHPSHLANWTSPFLSEYFLKSHCSVVAFSILNKITLGQFKTSGICLKQIIICHGMNQFNKGDWKWNTFDPISTLFVLLPTRTPCPFFLLYYFFKNSNQILCVKHLSLICSAQIKTVHKICLAGYYDPRQQLLPCLHRQWLSRNQRFGAPPWLPGSFLWKSLCNRFVSFVFLFFGSVRLHCLSFYTQIYI